MAAEVLLAAGRRVELFDRMPSVGRKFLLAGKGGLNLTHAEPFDAFVARYAGRAAALRPLLRDFGADELRRWAAGLGVATFVGSSGRVFPTDMKAAPLLRAWLHRLRAGGLRLHMRHRWTGWADDGALRFATPEGERRVHAAATVLALGGGSWARLGSDGAWVPLLAGRGVDLAPLAPSNCGFEVAWSEHLRRRFAGAPLKGVAVSIGDWRQAGEFVISEYGVEGSLVYAASARLREAIAATGRAVFHLDLLPQRSLEWVARELAHPRGPRSLATHLKTRLKLDGAKAALLWELVPKAEQADPQRLAAAIKALPVTVTATRPLDEAISTAGGVRFEALDEGLMLRALPGVFVAGEMLDWEAPTGGYLLTACFASGRAAGQGVLRWLAAGGREAGAA
ncbi:MAG: TIGR03862 family flavoprotein [Rubrivivax sp.]|nr:TIGR03862 family flavoprotein [Rubrivivax sp.]